MLMTLPKARGRVHAQDTTGLSTRLCADPCAPLASRPAACFAHETRAELGLGRRRRTGCAVPAPSILGSAAVLGATGAAAGKVRQRQHRRELEGELQDSMAPGHSGILALVSDPGVVEIRKALEQADAIVEHAIDKVAADDMKAAAKDAEAEAGSDKR
jgi:hypothetical protein